jgi:hypothetical protein
MSDWIDFDRWPDCAELERPGYVFEVVNEKGDSMLTECTVPLQTPFDWTSPPVRFRLVPELPPRHSDPIPPPVKK